MQSCVGSHSSLFSSELLRPCPLVPTWIYQQMATKAAEAAGRSESAARTDLAVAQQAAAAARKKQLAAEAAAEELRVRAPYPQWRHNSRPSLAVPIMCQQPAESKRARGARMPHSFRAKLRITRTGTR